MKTNWVKSEIDGYWYPIETMWDYMHNCVVDALDYFSEADKHHELYIILSRVADVIYNEHLKK